MKSIGSQIRSARIAKGYTQEALANAVRTTKATISRYEKDTRKPSYAQLEEIAKALDVDVADLLPYDNIAQVLRRGYVTPDDLANELNISSDDIALIIDNDGFPYENPQLFRKILVVASMLESQALEQPHQDLDELAHQIALALVTAPTDSPLPCEAPTAELSDLEQLFYNFIKLNAAGKRVAIERVQELTEINKYRLETISSDS